MWLLLHCTAGQDYKLNLLHMIVFVTYKTSASTPQHGSCLVGGDVNARAVVHYLVLVLSWALHGVGVWHPNSNRDYLHQLHCHPAWAGIATRAPCVRLLLAAHLVGTPLHWQESARCRLRTSHAASALTLSLTGVTYPNVGGAPLQAQSDVEVGSSCKIACGCVVRVSYDSSKALWFHW